MGFVLDMVTGEISDEDTTSARQEIARQVNKSEKVIDYSHTEYGEGLTHISESSTSLVEKGYMPDHLAEVNLDEYFDEIDQAVK